MKDVAETEFRAARTRKYSTSSGSVNGFGRSRRRRSLSCSGMPEKSCSMESTPISASIWRRSVSEFGTYCIGCRNNIQQALLLFFLFGVFVVLFGGQHVRRFILIVETNTYHPAAFVRLLIDLLRSGAQFFVDIDHFSRNGNKQFRDGFDRFHRS